MNYKNRDGAIAEAKALVYLMEQGYTVFTQFDGHAPFDIAAYFKNELGYHFLRVSVKSTAQETNNAYSVTIAQNGKPFDPESCDLLLVYITSLGTFVEFQCKNITNLKTLSIGKPSDLITGRGLYTRKKSL